MDEELLVIGAATIALLFFSMMLSKSWEQIRATRISVEDLHRLLNQYMSRISVVEYKISLLLGDKRRRDTEERKKK